MKNLGRYVILAFIAILIILDISMIAYAVHTDIEGDKLKANLYKAKDAPTPELCKYYLTKYLDDISNYNDIYDAWWYRNNDTSINEHKRIIQGLIDRCDAFNNKSTLINSSAMEYQLAWSDIKEDLHSTTFGFHKALKTIEFPNLFNFTVLSFLILSWLLPMLYYLFDNDEDLAMFLFTVLIIANFVGLLCTGL